MLAKCLHNYTQYLRELNERVGAVNHSLSPTRTLDKNTNIEYIEAQQHTDHKYLLLESALKQAGINVPVIFDEDIHLSKAFENNVHRFRYFSDIRLRIPVDVIRFSPGGSAITIACVVFRESG